MLDSAAIAKAFQISGPGARQKAKLEWNKGGRGRRGQMPEASDFDIWFAPRGCRARLSERKNWGKTGRNYSDYCPVGSPQESTKAPQGRADIAVLQGEPHKPCNQQKLVNPRAASLITGRLFLLCSSTNPAGLQAAGFSSFMGFRFRKRIHLGKGLWINLSKSGASVSAARCDRQRRQERRQVDRRVARNRDLVPVQGERLSIASAGDAGRGRNDLAIRSVSSAGETRRGFSLGGVGSGGLVEALFNKVTEMRSLGPFVK